MTKENDETMIISDHDDNDNDLNWYYQSIDHITVTPSSSSSLYRSSEFRFDHDNDDDVNDYYDPMFLHVQIESMNRWMINNNNAIDNDDDYYTATKNNNYNDIVLSTLQQSFTDLLINHQVHRIYIRMNHLSSHSFPNNDLDYYYINNNHYRKSIPNKQRNNGPSGLLIEVDFFLENENNNNMNYYHNLKKRFIMLLRDMIYQRFIIAPVSTSLDNPRLHRYIHIEKQYNNKLDSFNSNNNNHNNNNKHCSSNHDSSHSTATSNTTTTTDQYCTMSTTTPSTRRVTTVLPMESSSSMFSSEGLVSFIKNYIHSIPSSCQQDLSSSIWNIRDGNIWSQCLLGNTIFFDQNYYNENKINHHQRINQLSSFLLNRQRSLYMEWKIEDSNTPNKEALSFTMGVQYVLEEKNKNRRNESNNVTQWKISVKDILPPGLSSSLDSTVLSNKKDIHNSCLLFNKETYIHVMDHHQSTTVVDDVKTTNDASTIEIDSSGSCESTHKSIIPIWNNNNFIDHSYDSSNVDELWIHSSKLKSGKEFNISSPCFIIKQHHRPIQDNKEGKCFNTNSNDNEQQSCRLNEHHEEKRSNQKKQHEMTYNFWSIKSTLLRHGGQDGEGTYLNTITNEHNSCPVTVSVTQAIPRVIQPIWKSLHGVIYNDHYNNKDTASSTTTIPTMYSQDSDQQFTYISWHDLEYSNVEYLDHHNPFLLLSYQYTIPPNSLFVLSFDYKPLYLSFEQFPGDANRGFELPSAHGIFRIETSSFHNHYNSSESLINYNQCLNQIFGIDKMNNHFFDNGVHNTTTINDNSNHHQRRRDDAIVLLQIELYSNSLLILTPLPDMSMPFNVLSFTCTLYAFVIGSLFNLLIKKANVSISQKLKKKKVDDDDLNNTRKNKLIQIVNYIRNKIKGNFQKY